MTAMLTHAPTLPTFPACPWWCDQYDAHDPAGEIGDWRGVGTLAPRIHEARVFAGAVPSLIHVADATVYVDVVQFGHGSYGGQPSTDPAVVTVAVEDRDRDGRPVSVGIQPTAAQLRALIAAYTQALELLEGATQ